MGLFRPARTVTGPSGDYWELFVSKTALPPWKPGTGDEGGFLEPPGRGLTVLEIPFEILGFVWSSLIQPLLRVVFLLPFAVIKGRRSRAVRIQAVTSWPQREVVLWTTTDERVESALDEIVAGLAIGKFVQPAGCVYSGSDARPIQN